MNESILLNCNSHPNDYDVIDEVLQNKFGEKTMPKARDLATKESMVEEPGTNKYLASALIIEK